MQYLAGAAGAFFSNTAIVCNCFHIMVDKFADKIFSMYFLINKVKIKEGRGIMWNNNKITSITIKH
jgi:hypothetical protein